eukprot:Polyplicarium_translucidae@DN135_c0_g1_i1.p1
MQTVALEWVKETIEDAVKPMLPFEFRESYMPHPEMKYYQYAAFIALDGTWSFIVALGFFVTTFRAVTRLMDDRVMPFKEMIRILGMKESTLWIGWLLHYAWWTCLVSLLVSILPTVAFFPDGNYFVVFVTVWLFMLSTVAFSFMVCGWMTNIKLAQGAGVGLYIMLGYMPYLVQQTPNPTMAAFRASMILFHCPFVHSFYTIMAHQVSGTEETIGLTIGRLTSPFKGICVLECWAWNLLSIFLCITVGLYFHQVNPGKYGVAKPWHFPFHLSY